MDEKFSADIPLEERDEVEKVFHYLIGDDGTGTEDIIDRFSKNSHQYEKVLGGVNFTGPVQTAQSAAEFYPNNREDVYILDVAAGTGQCAEKLHSHGFRRIDALEPSSEMVERAKKKDLYGRYFNVMLGGNALDIEGDTYDAVTISGLSFMVMKKMPQNAFEELIRIVKPGKYNLFNTHCGYIINTSFYKIFPEDGDAVAAIYRRNVKALESEGKWKQVQLRHFKGYLFGDDGGVAVHQVL
ncbi:methyltransferase-like protein 27 [Haliotis cracherodii]|uniref:methyltransferase-like protein 27 n=1 Tax=Haliotis cracherodii TaxID=6455 RepID=UPI0039EB873C